MQFRIQYYKRTFLKTVLETFLKLANRANQDEGIALENFDNFDQIFFLKVIYKKLATHHMELGKTGVK